MKVEFERMWNAGVVAYF